jgi:hypothetical protein
VILLFSRLVEQPGFLSARRLHASYKEKRMAPRQMKMPEKTEAEPEEKFSQRKRLVEVGRFVLQVDRQTKGSYPTADAAHAAGLAIKNDFPLLHVTVYDSVEHAGTTIAVSAAS